MAEVGVGVDALQVFLTGGASNGTDSSSLGGAISTLTRARRFGMGWLVASPIPGIRIDFVTPACGEGTATLEVDSDGDLVFTAPGDTEGTAVAIAAGESKVVVSGSASKAVRVYRESGLLCAGVSTLTLVHTMNGPLGMADLTSAQRSAGRTTYRAVGLKAGTNPVASVRVWCPTVAGSQAAYSVGYETPSSGSIQTIASETTAPTSVTFESPSTEATALRVPAIGPGDWRGLWIRRVFAAGGVVSSREEAQIAIRYAGA